MKHQREHWASRLGFLMAAIGSAVGIGTLWQFPYVTGENGGGLFVLVYLICTIFIGIPVLVGELILGRRAQRGAVGIFATLAHGSRNWKMVGWLSVASPLLILSYYNVVGGWGLSYVLLSLQQFYRERTTDEIRQVFDILHSSGDICLLFQFLFTLIIVGMVYQGIRKGIEYWSRVMTISLLVILVALFAYSLTLSGFPEAFRFVLSFDASKLRPSGILEALGLAFFTLSLGQGVMLTYGSYMQKSEDIPKISAIVGVADVVVSLLAALVIFPVIFTFGFSPDEKQGLIFKTLPVLFAKLPGALVISTTFFVLFTFAALTSAIAMLEVIVANLMDLYGWSRRKSTLTSGLVVFLIGIPSALSGTHALFPAWLPMYGQTFFQTINSLVNLWILPLSAFLISIFVGWSLPKEDVEEEFKTGSLYGATFPIFRFFLRWIVPIAIFLVVLQQAGLIDIDSLFRTA